MIINIEFYELLAKANPAAIGKELSSMLMEDDGVVIGFSTALGEETKVKVSKEDAESFAELYRKQGGCVSCFNTQRKCVRIDAKPDKVVAYAPCHYCCTKTDLVFKVKDKGCTYVYKGFTEQQMARHLENHKKKNPRATCVAEVAS
jgi:hypothetical protein